MTTTHARTTDPSSSHDAAEIMERHLGGMMQEVYDLVVDEPGSTATELGHLLAKQYLEQLTDAVMAQHGMFASPAEALEMVSPLAIRQAFDAPNKRLPDLAADNRVYGGHQRACRITGRNAVCWYPTWTRDRAS